MSNSNIINLCAIGDANVGKKSLINSFRNGEISPEVTYMNCQGSSESNKVQFYEYDYIIKEEEILSKSIDCCILGKIY